MAKESKAMVDRDEKDVLRKLLTENQKDLEFKSWRLRAGLYSAECQRKLSDEELAKFTQLLDTLDALADKLKEERSDCNYAN